MKIFPEIEMQDITMPETGSPAIAIRTTVRAQRGELMFEEEFKGIYPKANTSGEYSDVVSHFLVECYAWQVNHIFTSEPASTNQTKEPQRVWEIFNGFKHERNN